MANRDRRRQDQGVRLHGDQLALDLDAAASAASPPGRLRAADLDRLLLRGRRKSRRPGRRRQQRK